MKTMNLLITACLLSIVCETSAEVKPLVVWDREKVTKGVGWANPAAACTISAQTVKAHSGNSAVEFRFKGDGSFFIDDLAFDGTSAKTQ
jgi:hypothetical protein